MIAVRVDHELLVHLPMQCIGNRIDGADRGDDAILGLTVEQEPGVLAAFNSADRHRRSSGQEPSSLRKRSLRKSTPLHCGRIVAGRFGDASAPGVSDCAATMLPRGSPACGLLLEYAEILSRAISFSLPRAHPRRYLVAPADQPSVGPDCAMRKSIPDSLTVKDRSIRS